MNPFLNIPPDTPAPYVLERREQHPNGKGGEVLYFAPGGSYPAEGAPRWVSFGQAHKLNGQSDIYRALRHIQLDGSEPWRPIVRSWAEVLEERRQQLPREVLDQLKSDFRNGLDEQHAPARLALTGWMETHLDRKTAESEGWQQLEASSSLTVDHVLSRGLDFGGLQ